MANVIESIERQIYEGSLSECDQLKLLNILCKYLNLQTITDYAKSEKISYNGAKKRKTESVEISGIKFIVNNE